MKKLVLLVIGTILSGCALAEPSMFIIENNSNYTAAVRIDTTGETVFIKKNKSEIVVTQPATINLTITIDEIGLIKNETFKLDYLEKKLIKINIIE